MRVGAVADRVNAHLEAEGAGLEGHAFDLLARDEHEPGVAGIVAVRVVQGGPARAQGAVGEELQGADREPTVTHPLRPALAIVVPRRRGPPRHRDVVAERKVAARDEAAVGVQRVELGSHLVDAGEAGGQAIADALAHGPVELVIGRPRLGSLDQALGSVDEQAGRLAVARRGR